MSIYEIYILKARAQLYRIYHNQKSKKSSGKSDPKVEYKRKMAEEVILPLVKQNQDKILKRNEAYLKMLCSAIIKETKREVMEVTVKTKSRLLVNVSSPFAWLIDEVGIDWDVTLDTPMIPESTIKGVISAALQFIAMEKSPNRDLAMEKKLNYDFLRNTLLGASDDAKKISFIDLTKALPIAVDKRVSLLERDVITPIYSGDRIEEHMAEPTPVQFLVIPPGVTFKFLVIIDKPRITKLLDLLKNKKHPKTKHYKEIEEQLRNYTSKQISQITPNEILTKIKEDIKKAIEFGFTKLGIGAKTSSGYGLFEVIGCSKENY